MFGTAIRYIYSTFLVVARQECDRCDGVHMVEEMGAAWIQPLIASQPDAAIGV